jgi:carboxyl-terminal processing protease
MLSAAGSSDAPAANGPASDGNLKPSARQRALAPRIAAQLEQAHYSRKRIDDAVSGQVFDRLLEMLDSQHAYLSAADIESIAAQRTRFDDMIHNGQLDPAFDIFALYQQRNRERMRQVIALLDKEPDWTLNENYEFERDKAPWAKSSAELDELWRKRVKSDALTLVLTGKKWPEVADTLRKRYERVLTRIDQIKRDEIFELIMNAYASVADPHTNYLSPVNTEESRIAMSLSYDGIGASLLLQDDYVTISGLIPGGPAAAAGTLQTNDRILGVAQGATGSFTDVIGWRLEDVVQLIRGKSRTVVRLQILPAGAAPGSSEKVVALARGKVTLEAQAAKKQSRTITLDGKPLHVGIITVPSFYEDIQERSENKPDYRSTTRDVQRLIAELKADGPLDALVLDLRGDGGGYLPEATALTGLFIDKGPVVQIKSTDGRIEVLDDSDSGLAFDGSLAVLVDRGSASASEIFAGAIQDYKRGLILGQTTFGKGTVQKQERLDLWSGQSTAGQINVTIGKFYRVTGESTQLRGVEPDISLPSYIGKTDMGESSLEHALPWDRVDSARFKAGSLSPELITTLTSDQRQRASNDPNFRWLVGSVAEINKARDLKALSLNLATRQRERETNDSARLALENARRSELLKSSVNTDKTLQILKSLEELKPDDQPDVVLTQAAEIAADLATHANGPNPARVAQQPGG